MYSASNLWKKTPSLFLFVSELTRVSEETSPVLSPVIPPVLECQSPAQSLSQSQNSRTEESERPTEQQPPPLEVPPESSKAPLHVPMSNVILESVPMTHISTSLVAGGIGSFQFTQISFFPMPVLSSYLERLLISAVLCWLYNISSFTFSPITTAKACGDSRCIEQPSALLIQCAGTY